MLTSYFHLLESPPLSAPPQSMRDPCRRSSSWSVACSDRACGTFAWRRLNSNMPSIVYSQEETELLRLRGLSMGLPFWPYMVRKFTLKFQVGEATDRSLGYPNVRSVSDSFSLHVQPDIGSPSLFTFSFFIGYFKHWVSISVSWRTCSCFVLAR